MRERRFDLRTSCVLLRRHSCQPAESLSFAEKCADREQGARHRTCLHPCASAVLVAVLHRLTGSSMSECSRPSNSVSTDYLLLHKFHSSADEFRLVHLAVVVLSARMASNEAVSVDDENNWTAGTHFDNHDADKERYRPTEIDDASLSLSMCGL